MAMATRRGVPVSSPRQSRREHWRALLEAQRRSGLSLAAFCRRRDLRTDTLSFWKWKLTREAKASTGRGAPAAFVPIQLAVPPRAPEPWAPATPRAGSAEAVVRHFTRAGLLWPRRLVTGPRAGELVFGPLVHSRVLSILHNPRYAGAFVYGRRRQRKLALAGGQRYRLVPRAEWKVFLPNAHPGYVTWEEFETNQATLLTNANGYGPDRRRSPAREGVALLQGLVLCGRCGDRMTVRYVVAHGRPAPYYACQRRGIETAQRACQRIAGWGLDDAVTQVVLDTVTPATLDVALEVFDELRARQAEVDRLRRAQVERAREDAEMAQRQFMLVRPEHRLVADTLERHSNEKLARVAAGEDAYRRAAEAGDGAVTASDRARIQALVTDLPRVWHDPRTPMRERKRMLRLLIEDVTLVQDQAIRLHIRWKGGATTTLECPRPLGAPDLRRTSPAIIEMVRALATEQTDGQIAATLNGRCLRTGTGQPFHRVGVQALRQAYEIPSFAAHLRGTGWLSAPEIAAPPRRPPHHRQALRLRRRPAGGARRR